MDPVDVLAELERAPDPVARRAFVDLVRAHGADALRKAGGPEHLTASCFVFSPDLEQVLLTHHRKGRFWVQLGGHLEDGDDTLAAAARREAREESGLGDLELRSDAVVDLDRHELHGGFSCAAHWDVGFVALAAPEATLGVSAESLDVRWFALDALPDAVPARFVDRLAAVHARAARRSGQEPRPHP